MTSFLVGGPAEEPVSLAAAKAFLRIEDAAEDGLIETLIVAGRLHLEALLGRVLVAQDWRTVLDRWPADGVVSLPVGPLLTLAGVRAYDEDGVPVEIEPGQFLLDAKAVPARIVLPRAVAGMPRLRPALGIEIAFRAGYGESAEDVPADLKQALLTLIGYWFEHRDAVALAGAGAVVPPGFERLVAPYARVRL